MTVDPMSWTLPGGLAGAVGLVAFMAVDLRVSRHRVAKFAARQGLIVTADNCPQVIAYLAVTRRWRAAGLWAALTWYFVVALRHHTIGVNIAYALAGWFAGALAGEFRVRHRTAGGHAASLVRRAPVDYLPVVNRRLFTGATVACLALTAILAVTPGGLTPSTALPGAAAIGLTGAVVLVGRRVLLRPQPAGPADVLAGDDAIRRRSLRVLTASATALLLYCALAEVVALLARAGASPSLPVALLLVLLGLVAVPVTGWRLAVGRPPVLPIPAPVPAS